MLGTLLIAVLAVLVVLAVNHALTINAAGITIQPAPSAVEGALRIARRQLAQGEIDIADYRRIHAVLSG